MERPKSLALQCFPKSCKSCFDCHFFENSPRCYLKRLEIRCPVKGTVGSNPTLSASKFKPRGVFRGAFSMGRIETKWDFGSISAKERKRDSPCRREKACKKFGLTKICEATIRLCNCWKILLLTLCR